MKVVHIADYKPFEGSIMDSSSETEQAGYIPAEDKINSFLLAGMRLKLSRAEQYDYDETHEDFEESMDPTRRPNYDMADATQDLLATEARLKASANERKQKPSTPLDDTRLDDTEKVSSPPKEGKNDTP